MKRRGWLSLFMILFLTFSMASALADDWDDFGDDDDDDEYGFESSRPSLVLSRISLGQTSLFQSDNANTFTGFVGWSPTYRFWGSLGIRGNVLGSLYKENAENTNDSSKNFPVAELGGQFFYELSDEWEVGLGGGLQLWFDDHGEFPFGKGNVSYRLEEPILGLLDRIFVGYSMIFVEGFTTHASRIGVGLTL